MFITTPLIESEELSRLTGTRVLLKLESLQPSGSFKLRGAWRACERAREQGAQAIVCASGGNHGLAVAYASRALKLPVTVFLPVVSSDALVARFTAMGAQCQRTGSDWFESQQAAEAYGAQHQARVIHPFDDEDMIVGHASLVDEVCALCEPDAMVVAVGGGGLLAGVIEGLERNQRLEKTRVLAVETHGAHSLGVALEAGRPVDLPGGITSIAKSLGARQIGPKQCWPRIQRARLEYAKITDEQALKGIFDIIETTRVVVEPASAATYAALGSGAFDVSSDRTVVVVLCGGATLSREQLMDWGAHVVR